MNKILLLALIVICSLGFAQPANAINEFDKQRPDNVSDKKWSSLKAAVQENNSKLLPTPLGVGGKVARFGESVSIDGNRALIGSPRAIEHGVAYIFDYDGTTWNETQLIFPDDIQTGSSFGISVSLQGDRVLVGDQFNGENGNQSGAAYVYDLNNGLWELTKKLIASDGSSSDEFGISVSLSGDRALIGAVNYDDATNGNLSGAAYVFDYDGTLWEESQILTATEGSSGDGFGNAVSLVGDKALVGSTLYDNNNNGVNTGSAFLFELSGVTWSQSKQFLASNGVDNDKYGIAVSLSANRVLIGASDTDENFNTSGAAYVYEYDGSIWQETKLFAPDAASGDQFGTTVSIENNRLIVGAKNGEVTGANTGSAYVYDYDSAMNEWNFTQEIAADDITTGSWFASSIGLSGDKVIVGNFNDNDNSTQSGAAYVFDLDGAGDWQQTQKVVTQGATGDNFGYAVSIDGNRALVGAPLDDSDNGANAGSAYIFDYVNGQWSTPFKIQSSDFSGNFGTSVSVSGDTAIIGANIINLPSTGQAYIFDFDGSTWTETIILTTNFVGDDEFAYSVSLSGDRALVGAIADTGNEGRTGTVHIFKKLISGWQPAGKLIASDGVSFDSYGVSVSLDGDRALVGASSNDVNGFSGAGAAYIYDYDSATDAWEETKLQAILPSQSALFGWDVELKNDRAIIGARVARAAYIFDYDELGDLWTQSAKLLASDGTGLDNFGVSVSLDGDRVLVGASNNHINGLRSGSAYQYEFDGTDWNEVKIHVANDAAAQDIYGWVVALSGNIALIGAYQDDDRGTDSGSVYAINNIDILFADSFED